MRRCMYIIAFFCMLSLGWMMNPVTAHAEIASDQAFEGAVWEKILEDDMETSNGVVQSICVTDYYIIMMENVAEDGTTPDIVKAYYRYDHDENGQPVEQYSLAKRVEDTCYEHCNGMAYNPNTREIAVALYTNHIEENRGCIYLMDADTLEYKGKVKISDDYNILGIGYVADEDCYYIQTNTDGGYTFKKLDSQFQIIDDYGTMEGYSKGTNFQDLCVSGDYIINLPLTLGMGIGDYINMYSISRRTMVSDTQLNFNFEGVKSDEPESICELEPGLFAVTVTTVYDDGRRTVGVYKAMVPYNFAATEVQKADSSNVENVDTQNTVQNSETTDQQVDQKSDENVWQNIWSSIKQQGTVIKEKAVALKQKIGKSGTVAAKKETTAKKKPAIKLPSAQTILKIILLIVVAFVVFIAFYLHLISIRRERQRKLEKARRERKEIRERYES